MGGITIDSALQVGFMLWALQAGYQAVVQEFCLGWHSLTSASIQTVNNQCILYNKDPWRGPVGHDGKPVCAPLANAAAVSANKDSSNPYEALLTKPYNYHLNHWRTALINYKGKCLLCHDFACNTDHKTRDCPIQKKLGVKSEKQYEADSV